MANAAKAARTASPRFSLETLIAVLAIVAIAVHLVMRYALHVGGEVRGVPVYEVPLLVCLALGGVPLVLGSLATCCAVSSAPTCWPASRSSRRSFSASTWPARWSC